MAPIDSSFSTFLVIFAALIIIIVLAALVWIARIVRQNKRHKAPASDVDGHLLPVAWQKLRDTVEMENRALSRTVFEQARQVFLSDYASGRQTPASLTREYEKEEYLLVLDRDGFPSRPDRSALEKYRDTVRRYPTFQRWFQEEVQREGAFAGAPVLLTARWLCHLVGLRHGTVEIFLDPPDRKGHTLVQVRGVEKYEAPGAFDIPCAGHIDGTDTREESLQKELIEELNLTLEDLDGLILVEQYNSFADQEDGPSLNYEHRVLYRARLKPEAEERIQFTDGEVAGLVIFSVAELRELVRRYPDRVASGLADAIGMYIDPQRGRDQVL